MKRFNLSFAIITATLLGFAPLAKAVTFTVTQTPSSPICANDKVELTLTPDDGDSYSYQWSWKDKTGASKTWTLQTLTDYPTTTTEYSYLVRDQYDALVGAGKYSVSVSSAPTITVDKTAAYVLSGGNVSVQATGSAGTAAYEWYDASNSVVSNSNILSLSNVTSDAQYSVVAVGANGCKSLPAVVNVYTYTVVATPAKTCYGGEVTLTASSVPGAKFYWDDGIPGQTRTVYPKGTPQSKYTVTIKSADDALVATQEVVVDVIALPVPTLTPSEQTICAGETVTIVASSTSAGTFTWSDAASASSQPQN